MVCNKVSQAPWQLLVELFASRNLMVKIKRSGVRCKIRWSECYYNRVSYPCDGIALTWSVLVARRLRRFTNHVRLEMQKESTLSQSSSPIANSHKTRLNHTNDHRKSLPIMNQPVLSSMVATKMNDQPPSVPNHSPSTNPTIHHQWTIN